MHLNHDLGGTKQVASQPVAKITIDPGIMHDNAAGKATKKRPVFGRLLSLSATYVQGSAMAAASEWRDEVGCSLVSFTCG